MTDSESSHHARTAREIADLDRAGTTCASAGVVETREQVRQSGGRPGMNTAEGEASVIGTETDPQTQ